MLSAIFQGLKNDPGGSGHGFQARVESLESVRHGVKAAFSVAWELPAWPVPARGARCEASSDQCLMAALASGALICQMHFC